MVCAMSKELSREERLAAQLRANLKRRKAQKKDMSQPSDPGSAGLGGEGDSPDLSKSARES